MSGNANSKSLRWVPLESNPELFTQWASTLGLDSSKWSYHDVYGMDPALLSMVPQPVQAVLLLFPISTGYEKQRKQEDEGVEIQKRGAEPGEMIWWKQTIGNACGTMGLLHSLANPVDVRSSLPQDSPLASLISRSEPLDPIGRAQLLTESRELESAHTAASTGGQTAAPSADERVDLHFTCFVRDPKGGELIELDGRRQGPVRRGVPLDKQEDLLAGACQWIQDNYMAMDPDAVEFNIIALAPSQN